MSMVGVAVWRTATFMDVSGSTGDLKTETPLSPPSELFIATAVPPTRGETASFLSSQERQELAR
jgi:hypothetical protein